MSNALHATVKWEIFAGQNFHIFSVKDQFAGCFSGGLEIQGGEEKTMSSTAKGSFGHDFSDSQSSKQLSCSSKGLHSGCTL